MYLDNAVVYQKACCDREKIDGLETLPTEEIVGQRSGTRAFGRTVAKIDGTRCK